MKPTYAKMTMVTALTVGISMMMGGCEPRMADETLETRASALAGTAPTLIATATLDRPTDFAGFSEPPRRGGRAPAGLHGVDGFYLYRRLMRRDKSP